MTQPSEAAPCRFCGKPACEGDCINLARPFPDDLGADDGGDGVPVHSSLPPAEISRLQHSLSLAVEALGPFAKGWARTFDVDPPETWPLGLDTAPAAFGPCVTMLTLGDFRRAGEVHSKLTSEER